MSARRRRPPKERPPDPNDVDVDWRLFLAVPLPPEVRELVHAQTAELARLGWPVRWVGAEGAHLTLHFLGETPRERAELLRLALPAVVARHAPFDLRTARFGVFPTLQRPRVIWLGLYGPAHRLETLQRELGDSLAELEFPVEEGPFRPHITLGRVRNTGTPELPLRDLPEAIRGHLFDAERIDFRVPAVLPVPVHEVDLVRSHLSHAGARYETIARFPLADAEAS